MRRLFADGMRTTISAGLRKVLCTRHNLHLAAAAASLSSAVFAGARRWWGATETGAAAAAAISAAASAAFLLIVVPWRAAEGYVQKSLAGDMANISKHYMAPSDNHFWVAVDTTTDEIVGTVAVERVKRDVHADGLGWRWGNGEAELRRMSVATRARRKGQ